MRVFVLLCLGPRKSIILIGNFVIKNNYNIRENITYNVSIRNGRNVFQVFEFQ